MLDALQTVSSMDSYMADYYADPDMKRVYVNENRIILCYGYKKQIDFMDFNYNLLNSVKFEFDNADLADPEVEKDMNLSYVCSYLGKKYFYTLFFGAPLHELIPTSSKSFFLEVYDLEGNPVIRYRMEGKRPVYFGVDEETFMLYGPVFYKNQEENMVVYGLKGLQG